MMMFFVFFARTVPASRRAKPHCMKKTRKPHTTATRATTHRLVSGWEHVSVGKTRARAVGRAHAVRRNIGAKGAAASEDDLLPAERCQEGTALGVPLSLHKDFVHVLGQVIVQGLGLDVL